MLELDTATMTTTDTAPLLRAILLNPADDGLRLIYADAIQEQGQDEYAEFIRLQIDYEKPTVIQKTYSDRRNYEARCQELFESLQNDLFQPNNGFMYQIPGVICSISSFDLVSLTFRRGFVEKAECTHATYFQYVEALANLHPITQWVIEDKIPDVMEQSEFGGWCNWEPYQKDLKERFKEFTQPERDCDIAEVLFNIMAEHKLRDNYGDNVWRYFNSESDAKLALADAALIHARSLIR